MSRFQGWLAIYVAWHGSDKAITKALAAKNAGVRLSVFTAALDDPVLVKADAKSVGFDADERLAFRRWWSASFDEVDRGVTKTTDARKASATPCIVKYPTSEKYYGDTTEIGTFVPSPGRGYAGPHPEPRGKWHAGLDRALPTPVYRYQWRERARYLDQFRDLTEQSVQAGNVLGR